jgi:hypothetical protein
LLRYIGVMSKDVSATDRTGAFSIAHPTNQPLWHTCTSMRRISDLRIQGLTGKGFISSLICTHSLARLFASKVNQSSVCPDRRGLYDNRATHECDCDGHGNGHGDPTAPPYLEPSRCIIPRRFVIARAREIRNSYLADFACLASASSIDEVINSEFSFIY